MDSTNLIQPSLSNQQPPQPQIVNNVLFGGQNLPTTIKVQTSHQVEKDIFLQSLIFFVQTKLGDNFYFMV